MFECWNCEYELDDENIEFECPYCGEDDYGEGFIVCENCGSLNTIDGDEWECPYCANEGITENEIRYFSSAETCPECGEELEDDGYCDECGWGDVNQGWVGEHYG